MPNERSLLIVMAALVAAAAIALHGPGQLSYDSSVQIYEAWAGRSISWSPPFMSALLRWLGGGTMGTSLFVVLNSVVTYTSLALLVGQSTRPCRFARTAGLAAIILNPVIFCFVGIIWKDVLFGTWLLGAFALCVSIDRMSRSRMRMAALYALAGLIAVGPLIRQQGTLIAPIILIAPLAMIWTSGASGASVHNGRRLVSVLAGLVVYGVAGHLISVATNEAIKGNDGRAMSAGPTAIAMFDIAGVVVRLPEDVAKRDLPGLTSSDYAQMASLYTPGNPDFLNDIPSFPTHVMAGANGASMTGVWLNLIPRYPLLYAKHRARLMLALLDIGSLRRCLPTQVGIGGRKDYLAAAGVTPGTNARAKALAQLAALFFDTPVWRNWFYALVLCAASGFALLKKRSQNRMVVLIFLGALLVFVAAFIPTAVACDFRYLYPVVPTLSGALIVLTGSGRQIRKAPA